MSKKKLVGSSGAKKSAKSPKGEAGALQVVSNAEPTARSGGKAVAPAVTSGGSGRLAKRGPSAGGRESVVRLESAPAGRRWTAPTAKLRDIAEATFGPPGAALESVIGTDERVQITDTKVYPWAALASLVIVARDNSRWVGTGWFISARTLVTAGHCVFIHDPNRPERHGWVKSISVMPGRNGDDLPFGNVTSSEFKSVGGWTSDRNENFDYGAIIISKPLGDDVGTFGFGKFPDEELEKIDANVAGYPGDKPAGTLWYDHRKVVDVNPNKVFYDLDTAGGQSGAPVWRLDKDGKPVAVAVHAYGVGGNSQSNSGTRITDGVYKVLKSWMV